MPEAFWIVLCVSLLLIIFSLLRRLNRLTKRTRARTVFNSKPGIVPNLSKPLRAGLSPTEDSHPTNAVEFAELWRSKWPGQE